MAMSSGNMSAPEVIVTSNGVNTETIGIAVGVGGGAILLAAIIIGLLCRRRYVSAALCVCVVYVCVVCVFVCICVLCLCACV